MFVGVPEGTAEWFRDRMGKITASRRMSTLLAQRPESLESMRKEIIEERRVVEDPNFDPLSMDKYTSRYTDHGRRFEPQAIREYKLMNPSVGEVLARPGFFTHPSIPWVGASPDFIELDHKRNLAYTGQVKCPGRSKNHMRQFFHGMDPRYYTQVQTEQFVLSPHFESEGFHLGGGIFVTYDARMPALNQIRYELISPDTELFERMAVLSKEFEATLLVPKAAQISRDSGIPRIF